MSTYPMTAGIYYAKAQVEIATAEDMARTGSRLESDLYQAMREADSGNMQRAAWFLTLAMPRITSDKIAHYVATALRYIGAGDALEDQQRQQV